MPRRSTDEKRHAHELIDRMAPRQVSAVVGLLEVMLDRKHGDRRDVPR